MLVVIGPQNLDEKALYAIDQHLMRGGALIVAAGNMGITYDQYSGGLGSAPVVGGLREMLQHYGFTVEDTLVMDAQNEPFPIPVVREVGGYQVQEIQALDYPQFVDIRSDGMAQNNPIVSGLSAVTLNWASPITVDAAKNAAREVEVLLKSSPESWTATGYNIQPDFTLYPETGFAQVSATQSYTLAVSARGVFESFFKGKPSPLEPEATVEEAPRPKPTQRRRTPHPRSTWAPSRSRPAPPAWSSSAVWSSSTTSCPALLHAQRRPLSEQPQAGAERRRLECRGSGSAGDPLAWQCVAGSGIDDRECAVVLGSG